MGVPPVTPDTAFAADGRKGEGKFKPITWNAALDLIEEKIRETLATDGNKGLLLTAASGNMDSIKNDMGKAFLIIWAARQNIPVRYAAPPSPRQ